MSRYASETTVSVSKSREEIERILSRYGATGFAYASSGERAMIQFEANARRVRFLLEMPPPDNFKRTPSTRQWRSPEAAHAAWEKACRQRWRALALVIKAKLEAVECGITEFESEFLAHIMLPDGRDVQEWLRPQLADAYQRGTMPPMLPWSEESRPALASGDAEIITGEAR